jgi:aspartyl-tRNA(Asn)/glutamyl-tRNA(Gln) amidotransferase subunit B
MAADRELADLFEAAVAAGADAKPVANWIIGEVAPSGKFPTPEHLAELVKLVTAGSITRDQAREVLLESVETGRAPSQIVAEHGYAQVSDESTLQAEVQAVMDANPRAVEDYRAGKKQALGALMAELRKRTPQANPKVASELLLRRLG